MATGRSGGMSAHAIGSVFDLGPIGDLGDGPLLERYATDGAERAFAALVERHEALVWRTCLAILRDRHRAEDAFQATFLVLIRRSRSLRVRGSLGPWLHEVAARTALRLRAQAHRRRECEARHAASTIQAGIVEPPAFDADLARAAHEELARLPAPLRAPLVLCDLEGRTHAEAAQALGWPIGTVKSRQARGRRLVRDRLARRGLRPASLGAIVDLGLGAVPRHLVGAVVRQSAGSPPSAAGLAAPVVHLARETLHAMLWIKLRSVTALAAVALVLATGTTRLLVASSVQDPSPTPAPGDKPPPAPIRSARPPADADARLKLRAQQITTRRARIVADQARSARELAELAVVEVEEVTYPQDLQTVEGEVALAESDLTRAQNRLAWSEKMAARRFIPEDTRKADQSSLARSRFDLEQARTRRDFLVRYTHDKQIRSLRDDVEKARAVEAAKEAAWQQERAKEAALAPLGDRFAIGAFW